MITREPFSINPTVALVGCVFSMEYSLKSHEITRFTTQLGYFHDMKMLVVAKDIKDAVEVLKLIHKDGTPEGIKTENLGVCFERTPANA